ncbi:MAG: Gfo/Idh/MocA family oxidoreductase [Candidatus Aenigmatarchaeota archaeon]
MTYNAAIIGCGRIADELGSQPLAKKPFGHAGAYKAVKNVKLVAACDVDKTRLDYFSKKWNIRNTYTDYEKMLKNEKIDIVSVCTHAPLHCSIVERAAESGVKAIFCEKPMAVSIDECEKMIKSCKKNGVVLSVDHTRRWYPHYRKIKEMIEKNSIGELKMMQGFCPIGLMNAGTHLFDLLRFFAGDLVSVYGTINVNENDPGGNALLKFKNGAVAIIDSDWNEYVLWYFSVFGSAGAIKCNEMIEDIRLMLPKDVGIKKLYPAKFPKVIAGSPLVLAVEEIIDCIEKGEKPSCTGVDGMKAVEIAMAIHESSKSGKGVRLPLKNRKRRVIPRLTSMKK